MVNNAETMAEKHRKYYEANKSLPVPKHYENGHLVAIWPCIQCQIDAHTRRKKKRQLQPALQT